MAMHWSAFFAGVTYRGRQCACLNRTWLQETTDALWLRSRQATPVFYYCAVPEMRMSSRNMCSVLVQQTSSSPTNEQQP
eukprot:scaffold242351_cov19-Tisochrysis_lutea.AAC.1